MKVYVGSDHRGFVLKGDVVKWLKDMGTTVVDLGPAEYDPDDDYNDKAKEVARQILAEPDTRGVLICGSGEGEMMQANRFKGVRAVAPRTMSEAEVAQQHHNANILVIGADLIPRTEIEGVLRASLMTGFSGLQRYERRIKKLDEGV